MNRLFSILLAGLLLVSVKPCLAGYDEGAAAYNLGDYATALRNWSPLADQGNAFAQYYLGVMHEKGRGVPKDNKVAIAWYRKAAVQGNAFAQSALGAMYEEGLGGVPRLRVVAYALYNLSASGNSSERNKDAQENRKRIGDSMTKKEIVAGQDLSSKMVEPGNLLKAIDEYAKNPDIEKEREAPIWYW